LVTETVITFPAEPKGLAVEREGKHSLNIVEQKVKTDRLVSLNTKSGRG
jgi:hypothetical protein